MDNFTIIYKILKSIESAMDYDEFNIEVISPEVLNVSRKRWEKIIIMLVDAGYLQNVNIIAPPGQESRIVVGNPKPQITLKGLEYLSENSLMSKAAKALKGIAEVIS